MGRASRKGSSEAAIRPSVAGLSPQCKLVGFGEDLASTPVYSSEDVVTTLIYWDPQSKRLMETEVDIAFEYEGGDDDMDIRYEMRGSLQAEIIRQAQKILDEGGRIEEITVEDDFEFEYASGMNWDRTEQKFSTASFSAHATMVPGAEAGEPKEIEDPLETLEGMHTYVSQRILNEMLTQDNVDLEPRWMSKALVGHGMIVRDSVQEAIKALGEADLGNPRIEGVMNELSKIRGMFYLPTQKVSLESARENLAEAGSQLELSLAILRRALRKTDGSSESLDLAQSAVEGLEQAVDRINKVCQEDRSS